MHLSITARTAGGFEGNIGHVNEDGTVYGTKEFVHSDGGYQKQLVINISELPQEVAEIVISVHNY